MGGVGGEVVELAVQPPLQQRLRRFAQKDGRDRSGGEFRGGGDEAPGVRVLRGFTDGEGVAELDEAAALHDGDAVREVTDEGH